MLPPDSTTAQRTGGLRQSLVSHTWLGGLRLGVQFTDNVPFAITVHFALQPVVKGRELDVRRGEAWRLFYQGLQSYTRFFQMPFAEIERRDLISCSPIPRAKRQTSLKQPASFRIPVLRDRNGSQLKCGQVVRGVQLQFCLKCIGCVPGVADAGQSEPQIRVGIG